MPPSTPAGPPCQVPARCATRTWPRRSPRFTRRRAAATAPRASTPSSGAAATGAAAADHLRTELVADALRAACHSRRPTGQVIFHPDRGCQYTSRESADLATKFGIRLSVGRTGQCWDNALAESFFATLKRELIADRPWPSRATARTAIFEWIESWDNIRRLHSGLGYRSPAEYETVLAA